jgi:hypothetical protein
VLERVGVDAILLDFLLACWRVLPLPHPKKPAAHSYFAKIMKLFRGDLRANFEPKQWMRGRYGFTALFWSTSCEVATTYAHFHAHAMGQTHKGFVHMCEIDERYLIPYHFKSSPSYSPEFRNLIHTLHQFRHQAAIIHDVIDYPSKEFKLFTPSSVVVVFDFSLITNLYLMEGQDGHQGQVPQTYY